jgi:endonuclease-8
MPEGDTVWRAAHRLDEALAGRVLTRFELRVPSPLGARSPTSTVDLTGSSVHAVVARGKHVLMRIGEWTLHSHLKMEGTWQVYARGSRWQRPAHTARVVLATDAHDVVGFDLAEVVLVPTSEEARLIGHLGPDPLGDDPFDAAEAARRLGADPRPIHVALLDQRNVAGFGNEYANELLFLRGILPTTPATQVDAAALIALGARTIRLNRDRIDRTFTGDARPGRTTWVYRRADRPCRRCGTPIRNSTLGADPTRERLIFWCPRCQL